MKLENFLNDVQTTTLDWETLLAKIPPDVKDDLQTTQYWFQLGLQSNSASSLPKPLQNVQKWFPNATGDYTLEWYKADSPESSPHGTVLAANDILIIVRFENNFTVACIFLSGAKIPNCTNFLAT